MCADYQGPQILSCAPVETLSHFCKVFCIHFYHYLYRPPVIISLAMTINDLLTKYKCRLLLQLIRAGQETKQRSRKRYKIMQASMSHIIWLIHLLGIGFIKQVCFHTFKEYLPVFLSLWVCATCDGVGTRRMGLSYLRDGSFLLT